MRDRSYARLWTNLLLEGDELITIGHERDLGRMAEVLGG